MRGAPTGRRELIKHPVFVEQLTQDAAFVRTYKGTYSHWQLKGVNWRRLFRRITEEDATAMEIARLLAKS